MWNYNLASFGASATNFTVRTTTVVPLLSSATENTVKSTVLCCLMLFTLISNGCSIAAISARTSKISRMYYFLLHLSVADAMTALLTLLPELVWCLKTSYHDDDPKRADAICRFVKYVQMLAPYLSSYILVVMALDRYQTICNPMVHRVWKPSSSHRKMMLIWGLVLGLCIPQALIFGSEQLSDGSVACVAKLGPMNGTRSRLYATWLSLSTFGVPLVILCFCYTKIYVAIKRNLVAKQQKLNMILAPASTEMKINESQRIETRLVPARTMSGDALNQSFDQCDSDGDFRPRTHSTGGISRAKITSVKQTVVIIAGYVMCSTPAVGVQLWAAWGSSPAESSANDEAENSTVQALASPTDWFFWLVSLNSMLNPWIYIALNTDLKIALWKLLTDLLCCRRCDRTRTTLAPSRRSTKCHRSTHQAIARQDSPKPAYSLHHATSMVLPHFTMILAVSSNSQLKQTLSRPRPFTTNFNLVDSPPTTAPAPAPSPPPSKRACGRIHVCMDLKKKSSQEMAIISSTSDEARNNA